jgi:hypothetical protein
MTVGVFVSSTFQDLQDHRESVREVIRKLGATDVSMETLGARDERPKNECVRLLSEESQLFVGIYAYRYGYLPHGDPVSITETEYLVASERQLPRFIFLVDESQPWLPAHIERGEAEQRLAAFKSRLKANHICEFFRDADDLAKRVAASLGRHLWLQKIKRVPTDGSPSSEHRPPSWSPATTEEWSKLRDGMYANSRGFFVVHTLSPSNTPGQLFDINIYLLRHQSQDFSPIAAAEFFFGKYWHNRVFRVENEGGGPVGIGTAAYGPFLCVCRLHFTDGTNTILHRYIDFEAGRRMH